MIVDPYDKDQEMKITMLTPDKVIFQGNVVSVKVPGGQQYTFRIEGGFIEVLNNEISLLVSSLVNGNNQAAAKG